MGTVILVRHGRTTANAAGVLAGRMPGVGLDAVGVAQAEATAQRLAPITLVALVASPLLRTRQTARILLAARDARLALSTNSGILEADYGDWQGQSLAELSKDPLWPTVQRHPSQMTFPGGESMLHMQDRAVKAIRRLDGRFEGEHGTDAIWAAVSHADIIKAILADAQGMPLDRFQRIAVSPASVSIIRYGAEGASVLTTNSTTGPLPANF